MGLQVIQDSKGKNTGVFIPYSEWNKLKKEHKYLADLEHHDSDNYILANLRKGLDELELIKQGKMKTTSAKDFLNEL